MLPMALTNVVIPRGFAVTWLNCPAESLPVEIATSDESQGKLVVPPGLHSVDTPYPVSGPNCCQISVCVAARAGPAEVDAPAATAMAIVIASTARRARAVLLCC